MSKKKVTRSYRRLSAVKSKTYRRPFDSLKTLAGKRVRIAADALEQLRLKKLVSTPGTYFDTSPIVDDEDADNFVYDYDSIKKILADKNTQCNVCALGSLFCGLGSVNGDFRTSSHIQSTLSEYFDYDQMNFIEACYEGTWINGYDCYATEQNSLYKRWTKKYPDDDKRLAAILQNIVKNRGTFTGKC